MLNRDKYLRMRPSDNCVNVTVPSLLVYIQKAAKHATPMRGEK